MRHDGGEHTALTHATGDELAVLRTEVNDEYAARRLVLELGGEMERHRQPMPTDCACCSFLPSVLSAGATMTSHFWKLWIDS